MKTICAMRDLFKAMSDFETAFEKVYKISLNEAMILCTLKEATDKMTATNLSKRTDLSRRTLRRCSEYWKKRS